MEDSLSSFLRESARGREAAARAHPSACRTLGEIDRLFLDAGAGDGPLARAHAAFRGAAAMALGGQPVEAGSLLKSCLEDALYALHLRLHPGGRDHFRLRDVLETLSAESPRLGETAKALHAHAQALGVPLEAEPPDLALSLQMCGRTGRCALRILQRALPERFAPLEPRLEALKD